MASRKHKAKSPAFDDSDLTALCRCVLTVLGTVVRNAIEAARDEPDVAFRDLQIEPHGKRAKRIDLAAEDDFSSVLRRSDGRRFADIKVSGEERRTSLETSGGIVALVDAIDGSDLFERGVGNWCSAVLFFDPGRPSGERIIASFVAIPEPFLRIYYARTDGDRAWVHAEGTRQVAGPSEERRLSDATLCFYGQKATRLRDFADSPLLRTIAAQQGHFRTYNLAGNPMLVRLVDCHSEVARGIDAVVEIGKGQKAHDFVAGAYIAKKGGAQLVKLDGSEWTYEDLEDVLLVPGDQRFTYVAASTPALAQEIVDAAKRTSTKELRDYVIGIERAFCEAREIRSPEDTFAKLPEVENDAGTVLLLSPHPDDEGLTGALPLRLRREARMRVVNVPVTLGSDVERRKRRLRELERATAYLGFELRFDPYLITADKEDMVDWIRSCLIELVPDIVVFPHDRDGHPTHIRTHHLAIEALGGSSEVSCTIVESEYWQAMTEPPPNFVVACSSHEVADLVTAVSLHRGEIKRAPYHLRLPAWMMDNARRAELLTGMGGLPPDLVFATLYRVRHWVSGKLTARPFDAARVVGVNDDIATIVAELAGT